MKLFNRDFILCLLVQFWFMLAFHMATPQIAQFVVLLGENTAIAGFVAGVFSLLALAFRPISGFVADRYYRKRVLLFGYLFCIVSYFGYAVSPNYLIVLVFRVIHALGLCIQTTLISVIAMDFIPKNRVVEGVGWVSIAATCGMGLGPSLGVTLSAAIGHRFSFAIAGVAMLVTIVLLFLLPIKKQERRQSKGFSLNSFVNIRALPIMFTALSFAFCLGITTSMLVLVGDVRGIEGIALFYLIASVLMAVIRPFSGRLVDRKGLSAIMPFAFVSEAACMVLNAIAHALPVVLVAAICRACGQGIAQAALQGQALKEADESERGTTNSTFYMGIDIGQGCGAIIGGLIANSFGFEPMFLAGPVALIGGVASYLVWLRRHRAETAHGDELSQGE